jgi:hypothetical protein
VDSTCVWMAAKVLIYTQPANTMCWAAPSADMSQDDLQRSFSNGAFPWATQLTHSSLPENVAPLHSGSSCFPGMYDASHSSESLQYPSPNYSLDHSGLVGSMPANPSWADVPLDPNAIYHVSVLVPSERSNLRTHCYMNRCQSMVRPGRAP